ncbi:MAG: OmpA family protein [Thiomargarita sp.]|nr:OmpA family protein [Thiomargarita sp.]
MIKIILAIFLLTFQYFTWAEKPIIANSEIEITDIIQALQKPPRTRGYRNPGSIEDDEPPKIVALIHFEFDSAAILEKSKPLLNKFGQVLQSKQRANSILMITGHTDSVGNDIYNLALSYKRSESVRKYLDEKYGLTEQRLVIRAHGEEQPIDTNETESGRTLNRRVESIRID